MTKISITRALTEIKNLQDQINKATQSAVFCVVAKGRGDRKSLIGTSRSVTAAEESIKSVYQKITDLITRRRALKAAVQASNAKTEVIVGGTAMLVADAIERKNSIDFELNMFNAMRQQWTTGVSKIEQLNATLNNQIETAVTAAYNNDKGKVTEDQYAAVANPRLNEHEASLIDPLHLADLIEEQHEKLNGFLMEVDFVLSESNAKTEIEI